MNSLTSVRFGILGLGQIGGSLGKALKLRNLGALVSGYDIDRELQQEALQQGIIDHSAEDAAGLFSLSEIVILATPIAGIMEALTQHGDLLRDKLLVTDVGSLKTEIMARAASANLANFVGGHPLAGTERRGPASWDGNLFSGANYFYTTPNGNTGKPVELLLSMLHGIDAVPLPVLAPAHDAVFATTSNLPHLFAYCLRDVYNRMGNDGAKKEDFVCPSFFGATRIAASDPEMVFQMLWYNRDNLTKSLASLRTSLNAAQEALDSGDEKAFRQIFELDPKQKLT